MSEEKLYPKRKEIQCLDCYHRYSGGGGLDCCAGEDMNRYDECDLKLTVDSQFPDYVESPPKSMEGLEDPKPVTPDPPKFVVKIMPAPDPLSPSHYVDLTPQPYQVAKAWKLNFFLGSAVKYIARAGRKPGASEEQDLRKAITFLELYLEDPKESQ